MLRSAAVFLGLVASTATALADPRDDCFQLQDVDRAQAWLRAASRAELLAYLQEASRKGSLESMSLARIEDSFRRGDVLVRFGHAIGGTEAAGQKGSAEGSDQQAAAQDMGDRPFAHPYFWAGFICTGL